MVAKRRDGFGDATTNLLQLSIQGVAAVASTRALPMAPRRDCLSPVSADVTFLQQCFVHRRERYRGDKLPGGSEGKPKKTDGRQPYLRLTLRTPEHRQAGRYGFSPVGASVNCSLQQRLLFARGTRPHKTERPSGKISSILCAIRISTHERLPRSGDATTGAK
jgi:hypothetical protein